MRILVCNIGSTSLKSRLFELSEHEEREIAVASAERIGGIAGSASVTVLGGRSEKASRNFVTHEDAIGYVLGQFHDLGALDHLTDLNAVAFKAVMAGDCEPIALVDESLLKLMDLFSSVAPSHNPQYIAAMRSFAKVVPNTPLVAVFESGFHRTIPLRRQRYAVSPEWAVEFGVRRYGFHGASHEYIAGRTAELMVGGQTRRVVSCHLGGSSSICAIRDGRSVATSMGLSPQSGLPQTTRVGDFDVYGLGLMVARTGRKIEDLMAILGSQSGLAALSGTSGDMRDIEVAAAYGDQRAKLAFDVFVTSIRDFVGAYLVELAGADALVFTGGIGANDANIREAVCLGLESLGIVLDGSKNREAKGECRIEAGQSKTAIWAMPTNEELVVARRASAFLRERT